MDCLVYFMMIFYFRWICILLFFLERRNMMIKINLSLIYLIWCLEGNLNVNWFFIFYFILKWKSKYGNFVKFIGSLILLGGLVGEGEVEIIWDGEYRVFLFFSFFFMYIFKRWKICVLINLRWVLFLISW